MPEPELLPFRYNSRRRIQPIESRPYTSLGQAIQPVKIPEVGFLSGIYVRFTGTINLTAAGALADLGPWSLVKKFQVLSNQGAADIVSASGFGMFLRNTRLEAGYRPDLGGAGSASPDADLFQAGVAAGNNTWNLLWYIPISMNRGKQREVGLINVQAPEVNITVEITGESAAANIVSNFNTISGTFSVHYEYFDAPSEGVALPLLSICRILEDTQPILVTGDSTYEIPRQGALLDLIETVVINGARSNDWDSISVKINKTDSVMNSSKFTAKFEQRVYHGINLPTGVIVRDFWHSEEVLTEGDMPDTFDTEAYTSLDLITVINSGAVFGANNNFRVLQRRILQLFE